MSEHDGGFGRRGTMRTAGQAPRPAPVSSGGGISPLIKQFGGMALGVLLAFAIGAAYVTFMKQRGNEVARNFLERANAGNFDAASVGDDPLLQRVHRVCTNIASAAKLTNEQRRLTRANDSLFIVESRVANAGAYVACLTTQQPQRFCQEAHREQLFQALRQYYLSVDNAHFEWQSQMNGPAAMVLGPIELNELIAVRMPSVRMDPDLQAGLAALDANGYVNVRDLGRLLPNGNLVRTPRGMPPIPVFGSTNQTKRNACG